jgi:hypothetical protein
MDEETKRQLIANCRRSSGRSVLMPHEWTPHKVELPGMPGFYFSDAGAWDLIADRLQAGVGFDVITLSTPAGATAICFEVQLHTDRRPVYVKVQLGYSNKAIGRSFHHSHF